MEQSCYYAGRFGPRVATIAIPADRGLVEPWAGEILVLQQPDANGIGVIQGCLERRREIEVTQVSLSAVAEGELGGRVTARRIGQLAK